MKITDNTVSISQFMAKNIPGSVVRQVCDGYSHRDIQKVIRRTPKKFLWWRWEDVDYGPVICQTEPSRVSVLAEQWEEWGNEISRIIQLFESETNREVVLRKVNNILEEQEYFY